MMRIIWRRVIGTLLMMLAVCVWTDVVMAETDPVSMSELTGFVDAVKIRAFSEQTQNDPASEEALSEDGVFFQYEFGAVYADRTEMTTDTELNAFLVMDQDIAGPRGVAVDWDVNQVMKNFPCDNPDMGGTYDRALLYLTGGPETEFGYGVVERDGQRISAMEYGVADLTSGKRVPMTLLISGDGVNAIRMEGMTEYRDADALTELYYELEKLGHSMAYARVPRSLDGSSLEMFQESDLDFSSLSYQTAQPEIFGNNVEDVLIDNDDGTWLRRVDGDGFSAVFTCDEDGGNAELISYTILSQDLEGPRAVRLGDLFHEDYQRFRNGEGELDAAGTIEALYGTMGQAPYGLAEYGNGEEMTLRYVAETLSGALIELLLRYENTVLTEITLHTL